MYLVAKDALPKNAHVLKVPPSATAKKTGFFKRRNAPKNGPVEENKQFLKLYEAITHPDL